MAERRRAHIVRISIAGIVLIVLIGLFSYFVLLPARDLAYVDSAIGSLRILNNGANAYKAGHPQQGFPKTLQDMYRDALIDDALAAAMKNHYQFIYIPRVSAKGTV